MHLAYFDVGHAGNILQRVAFFNVREGLYNPSHIGRPSRRQPLGRVTVSIRDSDFWSSRILPGDLEVEYQPLEYG